MEISVLESGAAKVLARIPNTLDRSQLDSRFQKAGRVFECALLRRHQTGVCSNAHFQSTGPGGQRAPGTPPFGSRLIASIGMRVASCANGNCWPAAARTAQRARSACRPRMLVFVLKYPSMDVADESAANQAWATRFIVNVLGPRAVTAGKRLLRVTETFPNTIASLKTMANW